MHINQTKDESLKSGGPQYYLDGVPDHIKEFLRKRGACPVVLQTPYGIASSSFTAVGRDHKISGAGKIVAGKVGRDRIQDKTFIGKHGAEKIENAAIRLTDGSVFAGLTHADAWEKASATHKNKSKSHFANLFTKSRNGFLTSNGRFVGRSVAYKIAVKSRQMTPKAFADADQDLWGRRPVKGSGLCALAFNNARIDKMEQ